MPRVANDNETQTSAHGAARGRAELWALGSALGYAAANLFDRVAVTQSDPLLGPFLRGLPSLVLGIVLVWKNHTLNQLLPGSDRFIGQRAILPFVWAGVLSTLGLFIYYFAMQVGGVILTVPVLETWVIWGTLVAWFFLGEKLRGFLLVGWGLIALGLIALVLGQLRGKPLTAGWYWAMPLAALAAVTYGVSGVLWRHGQLRGAHQSTAILLQFVTSCAVGLGGLVAFGRLGLLITTPARTLLNFLSSGVLSGVIAIYCIFTALRLMEVARVYAFSSLTPLVAALFAHFVLHEYLDLWMLAGVLLICLGVTLTQVFQRQEAKRASAGSPM
ncbi:MAG TPA: DMT family transporter [Terriglobia bacterium]|nr:DMT family transporter [Terriglobia bacterium]